MKTQHTGEIDGLRIKASLKPNSNAELEKISCKACRELNFHLSVTVVIERIIFKCHMQK
jgi:hypothetical protein